MEINTETRKKLESLQQQVDEQFEEYLKKDFALKLEFEKQHKQFFEERDTILKGLPEGTYKALIATAMDNFSEMHGMLPVVTVEDQMCYDCDFVKFIKAEYLEGYKTKVTVKLYPNPYVENTKLEREFCFNTKEEKSTQIKYKPGVDSCPFFAYFDSDEEALEMFDLFYEFYSNLTALAFEEAPVTES